MNKTRVNNRRAVAATNGGSQTVGKRHWKVQASPQAMNTSNPIREIIETMNLAENPNKKVIPLSIGDPTIFGNLKPCPEILDALQRANSCGRYYGYQTAAGMEAARESVADYHYRCTGNKITKQDVILASGCSHAIDLCICVLAKSGQNILIPRPGFPLYKTLTSIYGVHYKQYNLLADQNWSIDLKHLESIIDEQTAAIVINNPSNPCGSVFDKRHLLQILELADKYKLPLIADEIYDKFVFSPESYENSSEDESRLDNENDTENKRPSKDVGPNKSSNLDGSLGVDRLGSNGHVIDGPTNGNSINMKDGDSCSCQECDSHQEIEQQIIKATGVYDQDIRKTIDRKSSSLSQDSDQEAPSYVPFISLSSLSQSVPILTCGGISKTCLIPGLRLGWIIINDKANNFDPSIRNGLSRLTQRLMGPNSLVQGALSDILNTVPESFYAETMDFIYQNAKLCYKRLLAIKGLQPFMPQGSMYLMVRFEAKSFPGIEGDLDFTSKLMNEESVLVLPGKCFDFPNYFRICLTVPTSVMGEALDRIGEFCQRHYVDLADQLLDGASCW